MEKSKIQLLKEVLHMAWPAVFESVFISLASMIDTLMVSSLGPYAISAVGLTIQPKFIGLAFFISANIAVASLVARRYGENRRENANEILLTSLWYTIAACVLVSFVFVYYADDIIRFCGSNADTHEPAVEYFKIIMGGTFFNVIGLVINGAQRGVGNTKIAMRTNVVSSIVNIIGNYLLINGNCGFPAWGMRGAAIATVLGTVLAMFMSIASLFHDQGFLSVGYILQHKVKARLSCFLSILKLGGNFFLENLAMRAGFIATAIFAAKLGTEAFAAHNVGMNILNLGFSAGDGMQVAAVALIGRSLGEGRKDLAKKYGKICQECGLVISVILSVSLWLGATPFFTLFFPGQQEIVQMGVMIAYYIMVIVLFQISQTIYTGCLRGAGDVTYTLIASLVSVTFIRTLVTYGLTELYPLGLHGIWLGIFADQLSRFLFNSRRFRQGKWVDYKL